MDITLTADQLLLYRTAVTFCRDALSHERIRELEASDRGFDLEVWRQMAKLGWAGALLSPEHGGSGLGLLEMALIVEACGRAALPSPLFSTAIEAGRLLEAGGSPTQRAMWLPQIATGRTILTTALLERAGGYRPTEIATRMDVTPDGYRIRGTKLFVRDTTAAEAILCLVRSGSEAEHLTWILVPTTARGLGIRRLPASGGEPLFEVAFDEVRVDASAVVGEPGRGWPLARDLMLRGACLKGAELVGIGQAALELTVEYAKKRVQFDRPIGSFQAVHHHCADMYRDWQACRLLVHQAAAGMDQGGPCLREVSIAKAKASEAIPALTRLAHQIHGSIAYYRDYPLELYYHRALAAQVAYGDALFHRRQLAALLREDVTGFRGDSGHELSVHRL
jgi:alkylation response protein AidB-like acyl-CoA dehydrogenase